MQNNISSDLLDKLRKILALCDSNMEGERDAALLKAQELAIKYSIDLAAIEPFREEKQEPITKDAIEAGRRLPVTQRFVSWILANHFSVRVIYSGGRYGGRRLVLVGDKTDIEFAKFVNSFLNNEFMTRWRTYKIANNAPTSSRNSFIYGAYNGLNAKLSESRKKNETESFAALPADKRGEAQTSYALTVVSKKERIEKAVNEFFPRLGTAARSSAGRHCSNAFDSGIQAGRQINIARPLAAG